VGSFMGYLICEKCGGYYELQKDEFSDDFKTCECGGNLKEVENLKSLWQCINVECDYQGYGNKGDKCPKCGKSFYKVNILESWKIFKLKDKYKADPDNFRKKRYNTVGSIIIAYFVAGILMIPLSFLPDTSISNIPAIFIIILGGVIATYISKTNKAINGLYYGLLDSATRLIMILIFNYETSIYYELLLILIPFLGLFGGYVGRLLRLRSE